MFHKIALTYNRIERSVLFTSCYISIFIALFGFCFGIVPTIFCDSGPASACITASLIIEGTAILLLAISILIIAALRKEKPLAWYVRAFPLLPLFFLVWFVTWIFPALAFPAVPFSGQGS